MFRTPERSTRVIDWTMLFVKPWTATLPGRRFMLDVKKYHGWPPVLFKEQIGIPHFL
jgi:hypothetical protein